MGSLGAQRLADVGGAPGPYNRIEHFMDLESERALRLRRLRRSSRRSGSLDPHSHAGSMSGQRDANASQTLLQRKPSGGGTASASTRGDPGERPNVGNVAEITSVRLGLVVLSSAYGSIDRA